MSEGILYPQFIDHPEISFTVPDPIDYIYGGEVGIAVGKRRGWHPDSLGRYPELVTQSRFNVDVRGVRYDILHCHWYGLLQAEAWRPYWKLWLDSEPFQPLNDSAMPALFEACRLKTLQTLTPLLAWVHRYSKHAKALAIIDDLKRKSEWLDKEGQRVENELNRSVDLWLEWEQEQERVRQFRYKLTRR